MRDVGDRIPIRHEVYNASGVLTAATVSVTVTAPGGTTSTPAVTAPSVGIYDASFVANSAGVWRWKWTVSGDVEDVAYGSVDVADPGPGTYATLAQLRKAANVTAVDRDEALQLALTTAARQVDAYTGRRPGGFYLDASATARTYEAQRSTICDSDGTVRLLVDDIGSATVTVVTGDGTTWTTVSDIRTYPRNALADYRPITSLGKLGWWQGTDLVQVTARWGWPSVPDEVVQATLIQAVRLYGRKDSPEGVAGSSDFGVVRLARTDPDVAALLGRFQLAGIA